MNEINKLISLKMRKINSVKANKIEFLINLTTRLKKITNNIRNENNDIAADMKIFLKII